MTTVNENIVINDFLVLLRLFILYIFALLFARLLFAFNEHIFLLSIVNTAEVSHGLGLPAKSTKWRRQFYTTLEQAF